MEIHKDISRCLLNPPPKGQVTGSNPVRDANEIRSNPKSSINSYRVFPNYGVIHQEHKTIRTNETPN
ncbi:Uncharacterised protein [Legionella quateirensis]|uniref:Uncharacterized protein n=1 Tax=Legionella quateirensis TaxID=45072 RepID=A0A378KUC6_9GAMM|nr:hypothetical protein Lqua_3185 [Legionella quateirensis]STY18163.1 Uncharacterised protein [Legionella quateirensis]